MYSPPRTFLDNTFDRMKAYLAGSRHHMRFIIYNLFSLNTGLQHQYTFSGDLMAHPSPTWHRQVFTVEPYFFWLLLPTGAHSWFTWTVPAVWVGRTARGLSYTPWQWLKNPKWQQQIQTHIIHDAANTGPDTEPSAPASPLCYECQQYNKLVLTDWKVCILSPVFPVFLYGFEAWNTEWQWLKRQIAACDNKCQYRAMWYCWNDYQIVAWFDIS